eukprot:CAMPEP_0170195140 /NCGR_PEP_ID=MMETSP0040_2-20121228/60856_1 /TAXON_ID=641309 /ORGANISM="Lotharella oceanica, Strain CCMP622" /LENGTH=177 /DNA_ID=CAMNT_0010444233 /DNA_START=84 /DNA_END=615 /DNA_ORIENTATION=-
MQQLSAATQRQARSAYSKAKQRRSLYVSSLLSSLGHQPAARRYARTTIPRRFIVFFAIAHRRRQWRDRPNARPLQVEREIVAHCQRVAIELELELLQQPRHRQRGLYDAQARPQAAAWAGPERQEGEGVARGRASPAAAGRRRRVPVRVGVVPALWAHLLDRLPPFLGISAKEPGGP